MIWTTSSGWILYTHHTRWSPHRYKLVSVGLWFISYSVTDTSTIRTLVTMTQRTTRGLPGLGCKHWLVRVRQKHPFKRVINNMFFDIWYGKYVIIILLSCLAYHCKYLLFWYIPWSIDCCICSISFANIHYFYIYIYISVWFLKYTGISQNWGAQNYPFPSKNKVLGAPIEAPRSLPRTFAVRAVLLIEGAEFPTISDACDCGDKNQTLRLPRKNVVL